MTYYLQQATNLGSPIEWRNIKTVTGFGDPITVNVTKGTNEMTFYRLLIQ